MNYRCQDYVKLIFGPVGGDYEECGNTTSGVSMSQLAFSNLTVVFRTSEDVQGEGFEMYGLCFKQSEASLPSKLCKACV